MAQNAVIGGFYKVKMVGDRCRSFKVLRSKGQTVSKVKNIEVTLLTFLSPLSEVGREGGILRTKLRKDLVYFQNLYHNEIR